MTQRCIELILLQLRMLAKQSILKSGWSIQKIFPYSFNTIRQVRGDEFLAKDVGNLVMVKEVILGELVK
jgi:hypothetical protein